MNKPLRNEYERLVNDKLFVYDLNVKCSKVFAFMDRESRRCGNIAGKINFGRETYGTRTRIMGN